MKHFTGLSVFILLAVLQLSAQIDATLFRYPDVSKTQIVFSYANDLWLVPKEGGVAVKISSPPGAEIFPKFSPDGKTIAFTGNYDGNRDVYTIAVTGGIPLRLTEHGYSERVVGWVPDGKNVLFASSRESGKQRFNQFYTVPRTGGPASKLPLAYAEFGSYSPDGSRMVLTFRTQVGRNWKRYRGGWKADIYLFDFKALTSTQLFPGEETGYEYPMWKGADIYFLSDRGSEKRMNIWIYHTATKAIEQLTHFADYDIHFPSMGPDDIVFENAGKLYLFQMASKQIKEVSVSVVTDEYPLKPKIVSADKYIEHAFISPDGNRVLMEARGEVFSLPAENGFVKDLTQTSGVAERSPAWSPDGKSIAYWSDQSGEYELWIMQPDKAQAPKKLTSYGAGFRYNLFWSPDSKKIAFIDKATRIKIVDIESGQTTDVDKALRFTHGSLENFTCSWSADSRWLAYSRDLENWHNAAFIYDFKDKALHQATSGFYNVYNPVFDPEGKHLYVVSGQSFNPSYSDIDNSFIYSNSSRLAAISLQKDGRSLLYTKNDTVEIKRANKDAAKAQDGDKKGKKKDQKKKEGEDSSVAKDVKIDFDGLESRMEMLPPGAGNYGRLAGAKGKIIYIKYANTGAAESQASLKYYDIDKREEKNIITGVDDFMLSADMQKILLQRSNTWAVAKPEENQKFEKPLRIADMKMLVDPRQEWLQIFTDAWRMERDYFYDPNMHGVDWGKVREQYQKILQGAVTREDVDFIIGEMIGELNSSHTYHGGGDLENQKFQAVGYLGVNWEAEGDFYKIKKIIHGAPWDAETKSPLSQPGIGVREGDYILAVNGVPLTTAHEPFEAFQDLANKPVELTYNTSPNWDGAKTVVVQTMEDEYRLRNLEWIETSRKRVDEASQGTVGYIYVPSTGIDGQNELIRQFNAQWDKKALIIDERFNDGGQIPDRFIEMLNRAPLSFVATRDGETWQWPPYAHFGPKVMLINGWSGSGGDAFPLYFREKNLGPLIGTRTWGGLIGISGSPDLIDGAGITEPSFRIYAPDGTWFKEGHGVDPDIEVPEDLGAMARGTDVQLERAITEAKSLIEKKGFVPPKVPAYEKRN